MSERVKIDVLDLAPVGSWYRPYLIAGFEAQARWKTLRERLKGRVAEYDAEDPCRAAQRAAQEVRLALADMDELASEGGGE